MTLQRPFDSLVTSAVRIQPDARLARLVADGDDHAFDELARRHRSQLVQFAAGMVGPDQAEDVVQEALLKTNTSLRSGEQIEHIRAWLYAIVRNRALDVRRTRHDWAPLDESIDSVPQPPTIAAMREEVADVVGHLKRLPRSQREALIKREFEGRSLDEIATELDVSPSAVRGLIFRARETLRSGFGLLVPLPLLRLSLSRAAPSRDAVIASGSGGIGASAGAFGAGKLVAGILTASALLTGSAALYRASGLSPHNAQAAAAVPVHAKGLAGAHDTQRATGDAPKAESDAGPNMAKRSRAARANTGSAATSDRPSGARSGPAVGGTPSGSDEVSSESDDGDGDAGSAAESGDDQGADSDSGASGGDVEAPTPSTVDEGDAQGFVGGGSSDSSGDQAGDSSAASTRQADERSADLADSQN